MFDFIQLIFTKAASLVAALVISVGLVSMPASVVQPVVDSATSTTITQEIVPESEGEDEIIINEKLQEQLRIAEQKQLEAEERLVEEKTRQKMEAEEAKKKANMAEKLKAEQELLEVQLSQLFNGLIRETIKSNLVSDQKVVSELEGLYQQQKDIVDRGIRSCIELYDSQIQWVKDDAERRKTVYYESRRGFATQPGIVDQINQDAERDIKALEEVKENCYTKYSIDNSIPSQLSQARDNIFRLQQQVNTGNLTTLISEFNSVESKLISITRSFGVSTNNLSPINLRPTSFTCRDEFGGFSCRDNFGSNVIQCSQSVAGYFDCRDSNFKRISCRQDSYFGELRCSW